MNGVPLEIIQRAESLILLSIRGEDLVTACCQMPEEDATELQEAVSQLEQLVSRSNMVEMKEQIARDFLEADVYRDPKTTLAEILTSTATTHSWS